MPTPRSTADYYRRQQRILARLIIAARQTWRRIDAQRSWQEQYDDGIGAQLLMLVMAAQVAAARDADVYMADVLNELAFGKATASGVLVPAAFAGATGDGRPVETLLSYAVALAGQRRNQLLDEDAVESAGNVPLPPRGSVSVEVYDRLSRERDALLIDLRDRTEATAAEQALLDTGRWLEGVVASTVIDTARAAESAAMVQREWVDGYVRMLNLPSCSRCAVLAGKFYLWNDGFERHPLCDCRHIPAQEEGERFGSLTTNPNYYFDSLPTAASLDAKHPGLTVKMRNEAGIYSQEDIFTKAGAQAIRDGADISQVVNARRGMKPAQVFGHDVVVTDEGTTRRGFAYSRLPGKRANDVRRPGERYRRTTAVRLMPESIYKIAGGDRAEAIRLLKVHGYVL